MQSAAVCIASMRAKATPNSDKPCMGQHTRNAGAVALCAHGGQPGISTAACSYTVPKQFQRLTTYQWCQRSVCRGSRPCCCRTPCCKQQQHTTKHGVKTSWAPSVPVRAALLCLSFNADICSTSRPASNTAGRAQHMLRDSAQLQQEC
jgi:hypothetical protein